MIVVDMQNDSVASGTGVETPAARQIVSKIAEALRVCRDVGIKIIHTAHVHRGFGQSLEALRLEVKWEGVNQHRTSFGTPKRRTIRGV
jgi:nicotinamidase-related amidase